MVRIDMSEYMEKYSVSRLIGAPPGYYWRRSELASWNRSAKSSLAKSYGIQTGEPVVNAFRKCPNFVTAPPNHKMYREKSRMLMDFCGHIQRRSNRSVSMNVIWILQSLSGDIQHRWTVQWRLKRSEEAFWIHGEYRNLQ